MELADVAVQEGTFYHALLGQDVLAGDAKHLGQTKVVLGDRLDWVNLKEKRVIYPTPLRKEAPGQYWARHDRQKKFTPWTTVDEGSKWEELPTLAELTTTVLTKG